MFSNNLVDSPMFAYPGGKAKLRRFISRWIPKNGDIYLEPFVGRGNVFFLEKMATKFDRYILNDIRTHSFFNAIKNYNGESISRLDKQAVQYMAANRPDLFEVIKPIATWCGGNLITDMDARDLDRYRKNLLFAKYLLSDAEIRNQDANELLTDMDSELTSNSFVYLDPPYQKGKVGTYKSNDFDRNRLIELLQNSRFKWILSEYECEDFNEAFGQPKVFHYNVYVSPSPDVKRRVSEVLYSNMDLSSGPNVLDFGYDTLPCSHTKQLFSRYAGITKQHFESICPVSWNHQNVITEFNCLVGLPYSYWDGRVMYNLNHINKWPVDNDLVDSVLNTDSVNTLEQYYRKND